MCLNVKPTVVIADDHDGVLQNLSSLIAPEFQILATARDGAQAVAAVARFRPDVVILDISMPVLDGLRAARVIHSADSRTKIVFLTVHRTADYLRCALEAGGSGFVLKSRMHSNLLPVLADVLSGSISVSGTAEQDAAWKEVAVTPKI